MNNVNTDLLKSLPIFRTQSNTSDFESSINLIENGTSSGTAWELQHGGESVSLQTLFHERGKTVMTHESSKILTHGKILFQEFVQQFPFLNKSEKHHQLIRQVFHLMEFSFITHLLFPSLSPPKTVKRFTWCHPTAFKLRIHPSKYHGFAVICNKLKRTLALGKKALFTYTIPYTSQYLIPEYFCLFIIPSSCR